jgi:hypothetical protein
MFTGRDVEGRQARITEIEDLIRAQDKREDELWEVSISRVEDEDPSFSEDLIPSSRNMRPASGTHLRLDPTYPKVELLVLLGRLGSL